MYKEALRSAWAEINLRNLDYNIKQIQAKLNGQEIIGILKGDAYVHGCTKCAQVLRENGIKTFAVATLQEAIKLRNAGAKERIIKLNLTHDIYADTIVKYDITPVVCDYENAKAISTEAVKQGTCVEGFIAVDTGMGRIGYLTDDLDFAIDDIKRIHDLPGFKIIGLFSHLSTADEKDESYAHLQQKRFMKFYNRLKKEGIDLPIRTLGNSAAVMEMPELYYEAVRPGIIMYGCYPSPQIDRSDMDLKPVMSVKANIIYLKNVPEDFYVSYGRHYKTKKPSRIATIELGYADGYPRPFSPYAKVIVNGIMCPVAGTICMDQCMIDVSDVPNVKVGDEVIVMGSDGHNSITADDIAEKTDTINYEICSAFGQRLPKVYVK